MKGQPCLSQLYKKKYEKVISTEVPGLKFSLLSKRQNHEEGGANFCDLLRKAEL